VHLSYTYDFWIPSFNVDSNSCDGSLQVTFENCSDEFIIHFQYVLTKFVGESTSDELVYQIKLEIQSELYRLRNLGLLRMSFNGWVLNCECGCFIRQILES